MVVHAYADNYAYFSMNGGSIGAAYWGPWGEAQFEGTLLPGSNLLQIDAFNVDGPAGLLVTVINKASGKVMFHTDSSWTWQADD